MTQPTTAVNPEEARLALLSAVRSLSVGDQISLAIAVTGMAQDKVAPTSHISNSLAGAAQMTDHWAYKRIIAMGALAVPWILEELAQQPDHWFVALSQLTGASPVHPESRGRIPQMTASWLYWGRQAGHII